MNIKSKVDDYIFIALGYVPILISFIVILFSASLASPSGFAMTLPMISIITVFYWSVYSKDNYDARHVFFMGILCDILYDNPLGSGALLLIFLRELSIKLSLLVPSSSYFMSWVLASLVFINYIFFNWVFLLVYYQSFPSIQYTILQLLLTIAIYPFFMVIYGLISNYLRDK